MKAQALISILSLGGIAAAHSDTRDLSSKAWNNAPSKTPAREVKRETITTWDPPSDLVTPLEEVWSNTVKEVGDYTTYKNHGLDVLVAGKGKLNYCVRWNSTDSVTAEQRASIKSSLQKNLPAWFEGLYGFMGFPYDNITVDVVGWAVQDKSLLEGDTSDIEVYTDVDAEGAPQCAESCGRVFHQDGDYSGCAAGEDRHYDTSLYLKAGMGMTGFGGDDYQQVGSEYFLENVEKPHIFLHEFGHFLSLDDFYDWAPTGQTSFIMMAGSATEVTDFDIWMMRDWWRHLAADEGRYDLSSSSSKKIRSLRNRVPGHRA